MKSWPSFAGCRKSWRKAAEWAIGGDEFKECAHDLEAIIAKLLTAPKF